MKIPTMTTNDTGNGNMIEIAILIPKDIPIHIIWESLMAKFLIDWRNFESWDTDIAEEYTPSSNR
jgi:hypothetical protein